MSRHSPHHRYLLCIRLRLASSTSSALLLMALLHVNRICLRLSPLRSGSPGNDVLLLCIAAAFTSTGKPNDFALLCQLVTPCRPRMRFLFISTQISSSLPSHGQLPFRSWLQIVVFYVLSYLVFLQGTCTPFTTRPCWAHTSRDTATPISRPVYMLSRSFNLNPVIDARPR